MQVGTLQPKDGIRDEERRFMLNYQFIGYLDGNDDYKVLHAIELGTKREVAIHISRQYSQASLGYFILFLLNAKYFPKVHHCKSIGNTSIVVTAHHHMPSLDEFVKSHKIKNGMVFSLVEIKSIFFQLLDGIEYLHSHSIRHGRIEPKSILINDKFKVIISHFESAQFYSKAESRRVLADDIHSLGGILLWMLTGKRILDSHGLNKLIGNIEDNKIRNSLKLIFKNGNEDWFKKLYEINGMVLNSKKEEHYRVVFPDPIIINHLEQFGISKDELIQNLGNPDRKEYHAYRLYEKKLTRDVYYGRSPDDIHDDLYECLRRRRYLIELRRKLIEESAEEICSTIGCLYKQRVLLHMLIPGAFKSLTAILDSMYVKHFEKGFKIVADVESLDLEVEIDTISTGGMHFMRFVLNYGHSENFIHFVEDLTNEFQRQFK